MESLTWAREMTRYNRWQNQKLFALCGELSPDAWRCQRGMFFGSIMGTLNHILVVDRHLLLFAEAGQPPQLPDVTTILFEAFEPLEQFRHSFDDSLVAMLDGAPKAWFDEAIVFHSERLQRQRSFPRMFLFMQMFNHATHHRSQVTSELHKLGLDYGSTDLPYNPDSLF